jgi:hypothetical protein
MKELEPKLARIEIHAEGFSDVMLDGEATSDRKMYVTPGEHVVTGKKDDQTATEKVHTEAGGMQSVVLVPPPKEAPPPEPTASASAAPPPPPPPPSSGVPKIVPIVGAGLVLVGAGLVTWSGLDTRSQKKVFDGAPTQQNLDDGRSKETRTNVILAVTGGVAVVTTVVAVFFTKWGDDAGAQVGVTPSGVVVRGAFLCRSTFPCASAPMSY